LRQPPSRIPFKSEARKGRYTAELTRQKRQKGDKEETIKMQKIGQHKKGTAKKLAKKYPKFTRAHTPA